MEKDLTLPRCNFSISAPDTEKGEDFYICGLSSREVCCVGLDYGRNRCPFWNIEFKFEKIKKEYKGYE